MKYINIELLEDLLPDGWEERARKAAEEVRNAAPGKERSDMIDKHSQVWRDLKYQLRQLSNGKCWYCESPAHRILGDVDHHRPKKKIADSDHPHPGYWWLAFVWRNFRFACEICNRETTDQETGLVGGKGSHFPMADDEGYRVSEDEYQDYEDLLAERPLLLDPTEPDDPDLITFEIDGQPKPTVNDPASIEYRRAEKSIKLYHLDHSSLNDWRRDEVYKKVRKYANRAYKHKKICNSQPVDRAVYQKAQVIVKDSMAELRKMIAPDAAYSSAARAYLTMYRSDDPDWAWVDRVLRAPQGNSRIVGKVAVDTTASGDIQ